MVKFHFKLQQVLFSRDSTWYMILAQPYFLKIYIKIYVVEDPVGILLFDVQEQFFNDSYKFSNFSFLFFLF